MAAREDKTVTMTMKAPMRLDDDNHALTRFMERWWPLTPAERRHSGVALPALDRRHEELMAAVRSRAIFVEVVPEERQSIWSFTVCAGPNKGHTALMVVSFDGTVRTVLPRDTKRPTRYRPKKVKAK